MAYLQTEFGRFRDDFEKVGKYIGSLTNAYTSSEKRFEKFASRVERITGQKEISALESSEPISIPEEISK